MSTVSNLKTLFTTGLAVCLIYTLTMTSHTALATTPDGETPANEGVCDTLRGGTPGLYGLCVAYCEAQDLDSFEKEPAGTKILENYNKKKQAEDPDMPCLQVPCPCWSDEELAAITADGVAAVCPGSNTKIQIINNSAELNFAEADIERNRCRFIDRNVSPSVIRSFQVSPEEAQVCFTAVTSACDALGL